MHTFLIGFGFGMFLFLGWDSGDWTRINARQDRADRSQAAPASDAAVKTMDGTGGIPPRP